MGDTDISQAEALIYKNSVTDFYSKLNLCQNMTQLLMLDLYYLASFFSVSQEIIILPHSLRSLHQCESRWRAAGSGSLCSCLHRLHNPSALPTPSRAFILGACCSCTHSPSVRAQPPVLSPTAVVTQIPSQGLSPSTAPLMETPCPGEESFGCGVCTNIPLHVCDLGCE